MNEFLADMYNTRENIGAEGSSEDVEKLAEAQILSDELAAEGYDASELPTETLMKVAYQLWGENSALVKAAAEDEEEDDDEDEDDGKKGFEEKVAEADFLGRVMAHSFVDEQSSMDKEGSVASRLKDVGGKIHTQVGRLGGRVLGKKRLKKFTKDELKKIGPTTRRQMHGLDPSRKDLRKGVGAAVAKRRAIAGYGTLGAGTAAAAGLGIAGAKAMKSKKKESALDALAEERAFEMLKEAGYDTGNHLEDAVDQRAMEMLSEAGYLEG